MKKLHQLEKQYQLCSWDKGCAVRQVHLIKHHGKVVEGRLTSTVRNWRAKRWANYWKESPGSFAVISWKTKRGKLMLCLVRMLNEVCINVCGGANHRQVSGFVSSLKDHISNQKCCLEQQHRKWWKSHRFLFYITMRELLYTPPAAHQLQHLWLSFGIKT